MSSLLAKLNFGRVRIPLRDDAQALDHFEIEPLVPAQHMLQCLVGTGASTRPFLGVKPVTGILERGGQFGDREITGNARPQGTMRVNGRDEELGADRPERYHPGLQGDEMVIDVP